MVKREEFLETLSKNSDKELVNFVLQCKREGSSCLSDALSSCSKKQLSHIWETSYTIVENKLHDIIAEENVEEKDKLDLIHCMILMMSGMLSQKDIYMCEPMYQTAYLLKECFQAIPPAKDTLKNSLAKLFEEWWHKNLNGRHNLINTTLTYMLERSIDLKYREVAAVVNRVWTLHEVIPLIDLHAFGGQDFRELLKKCFICTQYIRNEQGIKFLAFVLSEDTEFTKSIHQHIKLHLVHAPRDRPVKYGEVYFRAWQQLYKAGGPKLLDFEHNCIQDLMSVAFQAQPGIFPTLRKILGYLHKQKKHRGVDEMLYRLYKPLIWRMLKVSNYQVRENAVRLFFDAFPIQNPDQSKEDAQDLLQKQLDLFTFLLNDPYPSVRSEVVVGVFLVMKNYWEIFPEDCLKNLMKLMITDMRFDCSSKVVRERVIRGFGWLLDNPLSHMFMKSVLPKLQGSFHDKAEVVRVAMVDLLNKVKKIREIRYWNVVPMEHLLARLVHDDDPVQRRIVELLFDNIVPLDKSADVKIESSLYLIEKNRAASREFYRLAVKHMSLNETVDYIWTLCKGVLKAVKKAQGKLEHEETNKTGGISDQIHTGESDTGRPEVNNEIEVNSEDDTDEAGVNNDDEEDEDDKLNINNTEIMLGLLEAIFLLWTMIKGQLLQSENVDLKKYLDKRLSVAVIEMEHVFKDQEILSLLVLMSGYLPANYIPTICRTWLPKLRSLTNENTEEDFGDCVVSLCEINRASDVFELALDWIKPSLDLEVLETSLSIQAKKDGKPKKKVRKVRILDPVAPQPLLGIKLLMFMFNERMTNTIILENHMDDVLTVKNLLKHSMRRIQKQLSTNTCDRDKKEEEFSMLALNLYWNLLYHVQSKDQTNSCLPEIMEILTWTEEYVIPSMSVDGEGQGAATGKKVIDNSEQSIAVKIIHGILEHMSALFLSGVANKDLCTMAVELTIEILIKDRELQFTPKVIQCLCEDVEFVKFSKDGDVNACLENILPNAIGRLFVCVSTFLKNHTETSVKVLQSSKSNMANLIGSLYSSSGMAPSDSFKDKVMVTVLATIIAEMSYSSQQYDLEEETDLSALPLLSKWLLEIIQKKPASIKYLMKNVQDYCDETRATNDVHRIHGVVHLLGVLQKSEHKHDGLKQLWSSLTVTVDNLTNVLGDEETEEYKDVLKSIMKKMEECKQRFTTSTASK